MNDKLSQLAKSGKQTEFFNEYLKVYPNTKVADISAQARYTVVPRLYERPAPF